MQNSRICEEGSDIVEECEAEEEEKADIVGCFFVKTSEYPSTLANFKFLTWL